MGDSGLSVSEQMQEDSHRRMLTMAEKARR